VTPSGPACRACSENAAAREGHDAWAVAGTKTGIVRVNPTQYHRGATFFVANACVAELHELEMPERLRHLEEMTEVAEAVLRTSGGRKMNYEALGNSVPHLHWWLTPRHADDPRPHGPIWEDLDFLRNPQWTGGCRPDESTLRDLKSTLLANLRQQSFEEITPLFEID
jgi:diadenosine tetraphosphate (Ap4A) HIT family hydrolase